jgi:hypothetical protein
MYTHKSEKGFLRKVCGAFFAKVKKRVMLRKVYSAFFIHRENCWNGKSHKLYYAIEEEVCSVLFNKDHRKSTYMILIKENNS